MDVRNSNGTFKPGHPGLKPKGSVSEFQKVTREKLGEFLISKLDDLSSIYEELSSRDKAKLLLSVAEFHLPKQKEIFLEESVSNEGHDLSRWSEEDLRALIKLHEKYEHRTQ